MSDLFIATHRKLQEAIKPGTIGDISLPYGWSGLLEAFAAHMELLPSDITSGVCIHQIKEKHGTIRIYCYAPDDVFDLVVAAELASNAICGICGRPGFMRNTGWGEPRCNIHTQDPPRRTRYVMASERQVKIALAMLEDVFGRPFSKREFEAIAHISVATV